MTSDDRVSRDASERTNVTFVYRGQLDVELSRVRFLLFEACRVFSKVDIVLLSPGLGVTPSDFERFGRSFPSVRDITFLAAPRLSAARVRRQLQSVIAPDASTVIGVGFSVGAYLPGRSCAVWCVNGIPEERLLHGDSMRNRAAVKLAWWQARKVRAARTVVVSQPMADLMANRTDSMPLVVPNTVDRTVFRADPTITPSYLTYQGGGSPWQGLDRLAVVWSELHRLDPSLRFRVITQDDRAKVLAAGLSPDSVDVRSTDDPREVGALLREARLGFLFRAPGIVNEVSWPMKLGEYLASGAPVVATRCGWDTERLIERFDAGLVLDWSDPPEAAAARIAEYLHTIGSGRPAGVEEAAAELDALRWATPLGDALIDAAREVATEDVTNGR